MLIGDTMTKDMKDKLWPLTLTAAIVILDQVTKVCVMRSIRPGTVGFALVGDLVRIVNVANTGVAFSVGAGLPVSIRRVLFALMPLAALAAVMVIYLRSKSLTPFARWCVCGILGGGIGNLIDRFFRPRGVVDFIDVKFFGLFGMERWPTFNVADSAVVVCGISLLLSFLVEINRERQLFSEAYQRGE